MHDSAGGAHKRALRLVALLIVAAAWLAAARWLWRSSVPAGLHMPHLASARFFNSSFLRRSSSYERFLAVKSLLSYCTLGLVLALYARRGHLLMRESAAGQIGTGMMLGMLGFAIVWLAELPFALMTVWWEHRHHVSHQGYVSSLVESFFALGGEFLFVSFALLVAMGLARILPRGWWRWLRPCSWRWRCCPRISASI